MRRASGRPGRLGGLDDIAKIPFTEKDEIRASQATHPPFGNHLAAEPQHLMRVFSTSGTTGVPCYLGLTPGDMEIYATNVARGYTAAGFSRGQRVVVGFNAGPFVAGAVYYGFDKIGCTVIPVGTGNTERMITAMRNLGATGVSCTPSYGLYLIDWCREHGIDTRAIGLKNMITAGEPGGGDPLIRSKIEDAFGCQVRESMGIGDISLSAWAEDSDGNGMHFMARDFVHVELIEPASGKPIPWEDGAEGELVYTALRREAMPLLRFRSRDHVVVNMRPNPTGRTGPRIRCIGRTDDMLNCTRGKPVSFGNPGNTQWLHAGSVWHVPHSTSGDGRAANPSVTDFDRTGARNQRFPGSGGPDHLGNPRSPAGHYRHHTGTERYGAA